MLKRMRRMAGRLVEVLTGREFLTMAGLALVSNALSRMRQPAPRGCLGKPHCRR